MRGVKIKSSRYYLRSLSVLDDLDNYLFWMSNPSNNTFIINSRINYTFNKLIEFIESCNKSDEVLLLGISSKTSNVHIGNIKYGDIAAFGLNRIKSQVTINPELGVVFNSFWLHAEHQWLCDGDRK